MPWNLGLGATLEVVKKKCSFVSADPELKPSEGRTQHFKESTRSLCVVGDVGEAGSVEGVRVRKWPRVSRKRTW